MRTSWGKNEEYLLVDLYVKYCDKDSSEINEAFEELSSLLRDYAVALGESIDDTYRNLVGIRMKYMNIAYVMSNGQKGLSCTSRLDEDIVNKYRQCPERFFDQVEIYAREMRAIVSKFNNEPEACRQFLESKIADIEMSVRLKNCLRHANIIYLSDLLALTGIA